MQNQPCSGICHADAQDPSDRRQHDALDQRLAKKPSSRSAERHPYRSLRAILQPARQHQIRHIPARHQQYTSRSHQKQLQSILILIAHSCHAGAPGNEVQRLLLPKLLLARFHIRNVARQPVMEFHLQLCFERFGIHSRTHSSDQVQEVGVWPFQPRRRAIDQ